MAEIYRRATSVICWLGESADDSNTVFSMRKRMVEVHGVKLMAEEQNFNYRALWGPECQKAQTPSAMSGTDPDDDSFMNPSSSDSRCVDGTTPMHFIEWLVRGRLNPEATNEEIIGLPNDLISTNVGSARACLGY
jgi:hypothetical protein